MTGVQAPLDEPGLKGAEVAVKYLNDRRGVLGKKVKFVNIDGKSDPVTVGNAAVDLIDPGAKLIAAPCDFDFGGPASREVRKVGIVGISTCASDPLYSSWSLGDQQFTLSMWNTTMGAMGAEHAFNEQGWKVENPFRASRKNLGILIIDHDMPPIMRLCHRLHVLSPGRTIGEGDVDHVRNLSAVVEAYLGTSAPRERENAKSLKFEGPMRRGRCRTRCQPGGLPRRNGLSSGGERRRKDDDHAVDRGRAEILFRQNPFRGRGDFVLFARENIAKRDRHGTGNPGGFSRFDRGGTRPPRPTEEIRFAMLVDLQTLSVQKRSNSFRLQANHIPVCPETASSEPKRSTAFSKNGGCGVLLSFSTAFRALPCMPSPLPTSSLFSNCTSASIAMIRAS